MDLKPWPLVRMSRWSRSIGGLSNLSCGMGRCSYVRRLSFKKTYVEPILEHRKTSTIRAASNIAVGDEINLTCDWGKPPFAKAVALRVTEVTLADMDDALARAEGFESRQELIAALADHYPDTEHFVRIDFALDRRNGGERA